jgi:hypothetical protein
MVGVSYNCKPAASETLARAAKDDTQPAAWFRSSLTIHMLRSCPADTASLIGLRAQRPPKRRVAAALLCCAGVPCVRRVCRFDTQEPAAAPWSVGWAAKTTQQPQRRLRLPG